MLTTGRRFESVKKLKLLPFHSPTVFPPQKSTKMKEEAMNA